MSETDFIEKCFYRTTIETNYRVVLCIGKCQCLNCNEEVKHNRPFSIFLKAENFSYDQNILSSCNIYYFFNKWMTYETIYNIFTYTADKNNIPTSRLIGGGRDEQIAMFAGKDINVAKKYLELLLKRIYKQCTEEVHQVINSATIFFEK